MDTEHGSDDDHNISLDVPVKVLSSTKHDYKLHLVAKL